MIFLKICEILRVSQLVAEAAKAVSPPLPPLRKEGLQAKPSKPSTFQQQSFTRPVYALIRGQGVRGGRGQPQDLKHLSKQVCQYTGPSDWRCFALAEESELMALFQLRIKKKTLAAFMNMPKLPEATSHPQTRHNRGSFFLLPGASGTPVVLGSSATW